MGGSSPANDASIQFTLPVLSITTDVEPWTLLDEEEGGVVGADRAMLVESRRNSFFFFFESYQI